VVVEVMFADVEKWLTEEQHWTVGGVCYLQLHCVICVMRWFQPLAPVDVLTGGQRWGGVCRLQLHCVMLVVSAAGTGGRAHRRAALGRNLPSTVALCDAGGFSRWHRWTCERCQ